MDEIVYEYRTEKVLSPSRTGGRGRRAQEKLLNKLAAEGWELVDSSRIGALEFGRKDTLTFRRPKR